MTVRIPVVAGMTEVRPTKKARWSRGQIRLLAWVSGTAAFVAVAGIVGISPKPAAAKDVVTAGRPRPVKQRIIIRRIIRRVVIVDAPKPTYSSGSTYTPTYSSSSSSSGGGTTVSAPAPAPPMSTGGSAPAP
jgi:hypothetical protein